MKLIKGRRPIDKPDRGNATVSPAGVKKRKYRDW